MTIARNPKTGQRFQLVDGTWKPIAEPLPIWSPHVVPGERWAAHYRAQIRGVGRDRPELAAMCPDKRYVDPPCNGTD